MLSKNKKTLLLIDSHSIIHRAYHALPSLTTKKGELVNAVYGFLLVFLKAIKDFQPDFIAAAFDFPAPTFRHKKYKEYKAKRPPAPEELYRQIPKVKETLKIFKVPVFEKEGFEADDIIATIANLAPKKQIIPEIETIILSGDLDTLQLVNQKTKIYLLRKGVKDIVLYDENLTKEKFQGLSPKQILDFKSLRGDPSDNIPGVTGIGEKTAIELLLKFGSLENLYKEIEEKKDDLRAKTKETLINYKDQAFLSKSLAEIEKNVPIEFSLKDCQWGKYDEKEVIQNLKKLEFNSLVSRLAELKNNNKKNNEKREKNSSIGENLKLC